MKCLGWMVCENCCCLCYGISCYGKGVKLIYCWVIYFDVIFWIMKLCDGDVNVFVYVLIC